MFKSHKLIDSKQIRITNLNRGNNETSSIGSATKKKRQCNIQRNELVDNNGHIRVGTGHS